MCLFIHIYKLVSTHFCKRISFLFRFTLEFPRTWEEPGHGTHQDMGGARAPPGHQATAFAASPMPHTWLSFSLHLSSRSLVGMDYVPYFQAVHQRCWNTPHRSTPLLLGLGPAQTSQKARNPKAPSLTWLCLAPLRIPTLLSLTLSLPKWTLSFQNLSRCTINWTFRHLTYVLIPIFHLGPSFYDSSTSVWLFYHLALGPHPPELPFLLLWTLLLHKKLPQILMAGIHNHLNIPHAFLVQEFGKGLAGWVFSSTWCQLGPLSGIQSVAGLGWRVQDKWMAGAEGGGLSTFM